MKVTLLLTMAQHNGHRVTPVIYVCFLVLFFLNSIAFQQYSEIYYSSSLFIIIGFLLTMIVSVVNYVSFTQKYKKREYERPGHPFLYRIRYFPIAITLILPRLFSHLGRTPTGFKINLLILTYITLYSFGLFFSTYLWEKNKETNIFWLPREWKYEFNHIKNIS